MTTLEMGAVLKDDLQLYLEGGEAKIIKTIWDLTSKVQKGKSTVTIPRISGLVLRDVSSDGTDQTASGMTTAGDVLALDQVKEVPDYIKYDEDLDSSIELKAAFQSAAPRIYGRGIDTLLATALSSSSATGHEFNSGDANVFTVANIGTAKRLLDEQEVPDENRYLGVNAAGMEILAATSEFQDGSKSLSAEALQKGVVSQVKGFQVYQSQAIPAGKVLCYHESAVAFALHDNMHFIQNPLPHQGREFVSMRGKYGAKNLDSGKRNVVITIGA